MITKIIGCADIHIRNLRRMTEYQEQLGKFIEECKKIVAQEESPENCRIVIAGDLFHNKIDISAEAYAICSWFLTRLGEVCKTIVIAGNHDLNMKNLERLDPNSMVFSLSKFDNVYYLDKELSYLSGCVVDDNVIWALYSIFDNFSRPNIEETLISNPNKKVITLFHGEVKGARTDTGYVSSNGIDAVHFDGCNFGILGHLHQRQELDCNGSPLVYCGSLIQQDHGENVSGHGFVLWDIDTESYEPIDIANENYGYYTFSINNIDDLENNKEEILNL